MTMMIAHAALPARQRGAVLVIGLIFLVVLSLIGVTAAQMASLEERMAGNQRDRSIAFQAAEMALRRAENHLLLGVDINAFDASCTNGLCVWTDASPVWKDTAKWANKIDYSDTSVPIDAAQTATLAAGPALPAGVDDPEYLLEGKLDQSMSTSGSSRMLYRITVRGQGVSANTVVWLQEIFYRQ